MPERYRPERLARLIEELTALRIEALALEHEHGAALERVAPDQRAGAANLLHYLAVRRRDLRPLQHELAELGLSSLGRMEEYVLATLDAVLLALHRLAQRRSEHSPTPLATFDFAAGRAALERNTTALLGPRRARRSVRLMVTLDGEEPVPYGKVRELIAAGADLVRFNCAKGDPDTWGRAVADVRRAERELGHACRVQFDLAGPNPRTEFGPGEPKVLKLGPGDRIELVAAGSAPRATKEDAPPRVGCSLPAVLRDARPGESIFFDDGKLAGTILEAGPEGLLVEIRAARKGAAKLRTDKSINLPETRLDLPALTSEDLEALDFVAEHADLVALSFLRAPGAVSQLVEHLEPRAPHLGIVLKVETRLAFERLPRILLEGLVSPPVGVMIARGDMGVELGFDRLAEVQEEILWLCAAAHVPVIWATQVLESLTKRGLPARGEITDAAMSGRAECVMLNRGEHLLDTVRFLDGILRRMQDHQEKKRSLLRRLSISDVR